jgi:hypothetical protein
MFTHGQPDSRIVHLNRQVFSLAGVLQSIAFHPGGFDNAGVAIIKNNDSQCARFIAASGPMHA